MQNTRGRSGNKVKEFDQLKEINLFKLQIKSQQKSGMQF